MNRKGISRLELADRLIAIDKKKRRGEALSKAEERIFAYHETAVECRCYSSN